MFEEVRSWLLCALRAFCIVSFSATGMMAATATAQNKPESPYYSRVNSFGIFTAYSNDSSHIFLGYAQNRKLLDLGLSYSRRLALGHIVNWQYEGELLPVALESDPVVHTVVNQTSPTPVTYIQNVRQPGACVAHTGSYDDVFPGITFAGTYVTTCGRTWVIGESFSPVGMQWNFMPRRRIQPFVDGHGGYMYSTQVIPTDHAGSFNFTFDFGSGLELYRAKTQSIRAEYRYHHISNHETADYNPGIDSGVLQVSYVFGR